MQQSSLSNTSYAQNPQLNLFQFVEEAFAKNKRLSTKHLYSAVADLAKIPLTTLNSTSPVGQDGQKHSLVKRKVRWYQQELKRLGLVKRVESERGLWELTDAGEKKLRKIQSNVAMLAYSTDLGIAVWGDAAHVLRKWNEPITLCVSSPPYPLKNQRMYGNVKETAYVDFLCHVIEPIVKNLAKGASLVLNLSNDIFMPGTPARSIYIERIIIALHERFNLSLMDRLVWNNPSKAPGPCQWASVNRYQLNVGFEFALWFTNSPLHCKSNNQRVLEPHTPEHIKFLNSGIKRKASNSDGAYVLRDNSFANITEGRIPKNVITRGHRCPYQDVYKKAAKTLGLPVHGAPFPVSFVRFLIEFLTEVDDLVVDMFSGSQTTPETCELLGRSYLAIDNVWEYLRGGAERIKKFPGYKLNPVFDGFQLNRDVRSLEHAA